MLFFFHLFHAVLLNVQIVGLIHFVLLYMEVRHGDRRAAVVQHFGYCLDGYTDPPPRNQSIITPNAI